MPVRPRAMIVEDQAEVVDFLSTAVAHGTGEAVRRIETHRAIVFLSAASAIKLKRAVRFDYMDYSTVARRRAACEAEVRINRRTAPSIHQRARAVVRRPDGRIGWDGPGDVLDWVVCMVRFDESNVFDELARRCELTADLVDGRPTLFDAIKFSESFACIDVFYDWPSCSWISGIAGCGRKPTGCSTAQQVSVVARRPRRARGVAALSLLPCGQSRPRDCRRARELVPAGSQGR